MTGNESHDDRRLGHVAAWESLAVDYVAGLLATEDRRLIEAHIDTCADCREAIARQHETADILQSAPLAPVPPSLETAILVSLAERWAAVETPAPASSAAVPLTQPGRPTPVARRWWGRLADLLDRPGTRKLTPALAAALILVVSLVGIAQLTSGESSESTGDGTTVAEALQAEADAETYAVAAAPEDQDERDGGAGVVDTATTVTESQAGSLGGGPASTDGASGDTGVGAGLSDVGGTLSTAAGRTESTAPPATGTTTTSDGQQAAATVYPADEISLAFVTVSPGESSADSDDLVQGTTGLAALPKGLWLGGPTYATLMPTGDFEALAGSLAAQGLRISVSSDPPTGAAERARSILETDLPTLEMTPSAADSMGDSETSSVGLVLVVIIAL